VSDELLQRLDSFTGVVNDPGAVAAAVDEIRRLRDIVVKLAQVPQTIVSDDSCNQWCPLCDAETYNCDLHAPPPVHKDTCPWRLAREALGLPWEGWHPDEVTS
jgi:hypothetical protein